MYDILITNGTVIDGTGRKRFSADVAVKNGLIYEVGDLKGETAKTVIDATGKFVTPGFVDVDNHSDTYWTFLRYPKMESLVYQGVTSIVGGGCGSSLAPLLGKQAIRSIQKWVNVERVNVNWESMGEYFRHLESMPLGVNFATLIGHSTIRRSFVGDEARNMTDEEKAAFVQAVQRALEEGALGLSTGLLFAHGRPATKEELTDLAKVVYTYDGIYSTHIRNEMSMFTDAVSEAVDITASTGVKTHISHLKVIGERYWKLFDAALDRIDEEGRLGSDISFSVFPYTASGSVLYTILPDWVTNQGKAVMMKRLRDWQTRREVVEDVRRQGLDYSKVHISLAGSESTFARDSIETMATKQNMSPEDVIINLILSNRGRVIVFMDLLYEENIRTALKAPYAIVASDGAGYSIEHRDVFERVHPRSFGAFPRVLSRYVREEKLLTWEDAIHKMTGLPAGRFGLKKRGTIQEDMFADILVLDAEKVQDHATFDNPYRYATGIEYSIINGELVLEKGKHTGVAAGKALRRSA